jgi:hypothetical protein
MPPGGKSGFYGTITQPGKIAIANGNRFPASFCLNWNEPFAMLDMSYEYVSSQISRKPAGKASESFDQPAGG